MGPRYLIQTIPSGLDNREVGWVLRNGMHLSGTVVRRIKWLEDGILLDGKRVIVRDRVHTGQVLSARLTVPERSSGVVPAEGPLDIVYEDADIVVIHKAAGVLSHPGHGHYTDTVGNYLLYHLDQIGDPSDFHPVHRLDKGTTGLMVVAKHPHAQEVLRRALHTAEFRRVYLAVCEGTLEPAQGTIDTPIGMQNGSILARCVRPDGQPSRTRYQVLHSGARSLVQLELETGRTHQIRVHMAYLSHPLVGDYLYGTAAPELLDRPALHSWHLELVHPVSGEPLSFTAPLPEDMAQLLPDAALAQLSRGNLP